VRSITLKQGTFLVSIRTWNIVCLFKKNDIKVKMQFIKFQIFYFNLCCNICDNVVKFNFLNLSAHIKSAVVINYRIYRTRSRTITSQLNYDATNILSSLFYLWISDWSRRHKIYPLKWSNVKYIMRLIECKWSALFISSLIMCYVWLWIF